jgi:hypothetical protein
MNFFLGKYFFYIFCENLTKLNFNFSQGYAIPVNYNPADFFIKKLAIAPLDKEVCLERVKNICDSFEKSDIKKELIKKIDSENKSVSNSLRTDIAFKDELDYRSNFFTQMRWLIWRNGISLIRNPFALKIQIIQTFVCLKQLKLFKKKDYLYFFHIVDFNFVWPNLFSTGIKSKFSYEL